MNSSIRSIGALVVLWVVLAMSAGPAWAADAGEVRQQEARLIAVLKSGAPRAEKEMACRQLGRIGTPACVPALAALLSDSQLSHMARYALEPMPFPEAGQALREALAKASGPAKVGVINSLGVRRDQQAVGELVSLLKSPEADIASAAAVALGKIGIPDAAVALNQYRAAASAAMLPVAAEASLQAAECLMTQGKPDDAARIYSDLQSGKWPAHVRTGAFVGLLAAQPAEAPTRVIQAIAGADPIFHTIAIASVATLKGEGIAQRFAFELPKLSPDAQVLMIGALARRGDAAARPAVLAAVSSPSPDVRTAALKALANIGDAACVPVLCKAVADGQTAAEKQAASITLRQLRGEAVNAAILQNMKTAPVPTRVELIDVLVERKAVSAVPDLLTEAAGQDAAVRAAAFVALGRLAEPKDLDAMLQAMTQLTGDAGRADAERAVIQVSRKIADEPAQADATLAALKAASATPARCSLLRVLGGIASPRALEAVQAALAGQEPAVQNAAVRALADWPDPRALQSLRNVFQTTKNQTHRILALRGCVRLLGLGSQPMEETVKAYADLLNSVTRTQDRQMILAGLANVAAPAALKIVEPLLADPQVQAEAELAMLSIASGIMGSAPADAKAAAGRLLAESRNGSTRDRAAQILRQIEKLEDYITAWQVSGPYTQEGKGGGELFDEVLPPEKNGGRGATWRLLPAATQSDRPWMLDLLAALQGERRAAYVRTWVYSDKAQSARLEFGTDDGHKVWLNGKLVHSANRGGAAVPGDFKAPVELQQGWNALMLKITQDTGPWEFCFRIRNAAGGSLPGLRVQPASPAQ